MKKNKGLKIGLIAALLAGVYMLTRKKTLVERVTSPETSAPKNTGIYVPPVKTYIPMNGKKQFSLGASESKVIVQLPSNLTYNESLTISNAISKGIGGLRLNDLIDYMRNHKIDYMNSKQVEKWKYNAI